MNFFELYLKIYIYLLTWKAKQQREKEEGNKNTEEEVMGCGEERALSSAVLFSKWLPVDSYGLKSRARNSVQVSYMDNGAQVPTAFQVH